MAALRFSSINGADGAGKSTVALGMFEAMGGNAEGVQMIANMDYAAWAEPAAIARYDEMIAILDSFQEGRSHTLPDLGTFRRRERACNAVFQVMARHCYESAARIVADGGAVVMHSDPILKGIMWAKMDPRPQIRPWDTLLASSPMRPDMIVHVTPHPNPRSEAAAQVLMARLVQRNGAYADVAQATGDPRCLTDAQMRLAAAEDTALHIATRHRLPVTTFVNDCLEPMTATDRAAEFAESLLGQFAMAEV